MIVLKKTIIYSGILPFIFCFFHTVSGAELVGIPPLSNQRYQNRDNWLGYYFQARIKANLDNNSDWRFHSQNALSLWTLRTDRSLTVSPQTTILIQGSFQQVAELGVISVTIERLRSGEPQKKRFEQLFSEKNLDTSIDELSVKLGRWISPGFRLANPVHFPKQDMEGRKAVFSLRRRIFEAGRLPEVRDILYLENIVDGNSPPVLVGDLAEAMIVMSQFLEEREQKLVFDRIEIRLRKALLKNKTQARLYALLAEVYYLNERYDSWIEKTADDAIGFDSQNDIAYLLKVIISSPDAADDRDEKIKQLRQVNPWLISGSVDSAGQFQKGVLRGEISSLKVSLN